MRNANGRPVIRLIALGLMVLSGAMLAGFAAQNAEPESDGHRALLQLEEPPDVLPAVRAVLPLTSGCSVLSGGLLRGRDAVVLAGMVQVDCHAPSARPAMAPAVAVGDTWIDPPLELRSQDPSINGVFPVRLPDGAWGVVWGEAVPPEGAQVSGGWPDQVVTRIWVSAREGGSWVAPDLIVEAPTTTWAQWRAIGNDADGTTVIIVGASSRLVFDSDILLWGPVGSPLQRLELPDQVAELAPTLAADREGRLWTAWLSHGSISTLHAARLDPIVGLADGPFELVRLPEGNGRWTLSGFHISSDQVSHLTLHDASGIAFHASGRMGSAGPEGWRIDPLASPVQTMDSFLFERPAGSLNLIRAVLRPNAPDHTFGSMLIQTLNGGWSSPVRAPGVTVDQYLLRTPPQPSATPFLGWTTHEILDRHEVRSSFVIRGDPM